MVAAGQRAGRGSGMAEAFTLYGHFLSGPSIKVGLMLRLCRQPFAFLRRDNDMCGDLGLSC